MGNSRSRKILWICLFVDDQYTLSPVFDALAEHGFRVTPGTWHRPGPFLQVVELLGICQRGGFNIVVLHYADLYSHAPNIFRMVPNGVKNVYAAVVRGFQNLGAKVILVQDGKWPQGLPADGVIEFPFRMDKLYRLLDVVSLSKG